jgi:hypothetical protein
MASSRQAVSRMKKITGILPRKCDLIYLFYRFVYIHAKDSVHCFSGAGCEPSKGR